MQQEKIYSGNNEDEIWQRIKGDFNREEFIEFHASIIQDKKRIVLDIDIDPGGGFENGISTTRLTYALKQTNYRLAIHPHNFVDDIGKLFGLEDVVIGYPEFDKKFIIKTNDGGKTQTLFSDANCRKLFETLEDFTLETTGSNDEVEENKKLVLTIDEGIINAEKLKNIYNTFFIILTGIETI